MDKDASTSSETNKENVESGKTNTATDILSFLVKQNKRFVTTLIVTNIAWPIATIAIVGGMYLKTIGFFEQYDFTSSIEQTGLYTFSDSEGNVISSDISPEEMERILEIINGKNSNQTNDEKEGRQIEENNK